MYPRWRVASHARDRSLAATTMSLDLYFQQRGIATVEVTPGVTTPRCFSGAQQEHLATRHTAGLFDFSFMGCFAIAGPQSLDVVEHLQTRNLRGLPTGKVAYTLMCRDDGSVLTDATIWSHGPGSYWLFTGRRADRRHLERGAIGYEVEVVDCSQRYSVVALQGPMSPVVLQRCFSGYDWRTLPYYYFRSHEFCGAPCYVARLGESGETGYEVVMEATAAQSLWERLVAAGAPLGLLECGFEAGNSLRIEAGHARFNREMALPITPYDLNLGRLVSHYGSAFAGSDVLRALRWTQPTWRLVGLIPHRGNEEAVTNALMRIGVEPAAMGDARAGVGYLTSVCSSPVLGRLLGLGFVTYEDRYPGTTVALGQGQIARVARLPFCDPGKFLARRK